MKVIVEMDVTEAQALTLQAMFEYWNRLASVGASRFVAFYVDGDGSFHPNCKVSFSEEVMELNNEIRRVAIREDKDGHRKYDFDSVAWYLHGETELSVVRKEEEK